MSTISLTVEESENQLVSGIPEYIELSTGVASNIFYTLDGTDPSEESLIYSEKIYLPTSENSFIFKALAVSGDTRSSVFEKEYSTEHYDMYKRRLTSGEGLNLLKVGEDIVDSLSYNSDGEPSHQTSISIQDLDIKTSSTDKSGLKMKGSEPSFRNDTTPRKDSSSSFINFPELEVKSNSLFKGVVSSVNNNVDFDPSAAVIVIDGSTSDAFDSQTVRIINRPTGTVDLTNDIYDLHLRQQPPITSNLSRVMYSPKTKMLVFSYYDSRENKWVESVQSCEAKSLSLSPVYPRSKFVFKWVSDRSMSKIF